MDLLYYWTLNANTWLTHVTLSNQTCDMIDMNHEFIQELEHNIEIKRLPPAQSHNPPSTTTPSSINIKSQVRFFFLSPPNELLNDNTFCLYFSRVGLQHDAARALCKAGCRGCSRGALPVWEANVQVTQGVQTWVRFSINVAV